MGRLQGEQADMGMLMIKCPLTGRAIPTGLEADRSSFDRTPVFFGRTYCPMCRSNHEWFAKEAWVHEILDAKHRGRRTGVR